MFKKIFGGTTLRDWLPTIIVFLLFGSIAFVPWEGSLDYKWWVPIVYVGIWIVMILYARIWRPKLERKADES